ncbi:hypothetical protein AVEN_210099-1 [Araneus ventricosus]|uniref:Uncharacterized protein n=1 Tax=Araneus ventricosus TaxID=182803 RepID=A0A4Y2G8E6_ARAVE|nr:hypothetical protein AVEN_210099-1 [Araneus ventricosus]
MLEILMKSKLSRSLMIAVIMERNLTMNVNDALPLPKEVRFVIGVEVTEPQQGSENPLISPVAYHPRTRSLLPVGSNISIMKRGAVLRTSNSAFPQC